MSLRQRASIPCHGRSRPDRSHIVDRLVEGQPSCEVVVLDNFFRGTRENLSWARAHGNVTTVEGDLRDRRVMAEIMKEIDVVFHLAAIRITQCAWSHAWPWKSWWTGTFNVLDAAVKAA